MSDFAKSVCMFTPRCKTSNLDCAGRKINTGGHICKQCQNGLRDEDVETSFLVYPNYGDHHQKLFCLASSVVRRKQKIVSYQV